MADASPVRRWSVIVLLALGMVIAFFDRVNFSVAISTAEFVRTFGLTDAGRGIASSAFFWTYAILQVPAGWMVDRFGVKSVYTVAFLFWSALTAATAGAGSLGLLIALRMALGCSEALLTPATMRWIRLHCSETDRGTAVGICMAGAKIGPALGVPVAVWLVNLYGWRVMFLLLGTFPLLWLAGWVSLAPPDKVDRSESRAGRDRVGIMRMMRNPILWGTMVGTFCYQYFFYFCVTWMPAYLTERHHLSLTSMGWYVMFSFGGMAILAIAAGFAADRLIGRGGSPISIRKAFTIAGLAIASTEVLGSVSGAPAAALFFAVFSLSGLGLATANYWALTQALMPAAIIGRVVGFQALAASLPGVVAPLVTGWLKQTTGGYTAPLITTWLLLLAGIASYAFGVRERYRRDL